MDKTPTILQIEGIQGECQEKEFKDWIYCMSFSWGVSNVPVSKGSALSGGIPKFQGFTISKAMEKSTPALFMACATGQHFKRARLLFRRVGQLDPRSSASVLIPYYEFIFKDLLVSSWNTSGASATDPSEIVTFTFAAIQKTFFVLQQGKRTDTISGAYSILERTENVRL